MENLEIFRNEFKKSESIKNLFEREWFTQFKLKNNANIFKTFYSELAGNLVKKLPKPPLKFITDVLMFYKKLNANLENFELLKSYCFV